MNRPCLVAGCPRLTTATRCQQHERALERQRGTPTQRGYGAVHREARRQLGATLPTPCAYGCGTMLRPGGRWVAAHVVDGNPGAGWIAACVTCNERAKQSYRATREPAADRVVLAEKFKGRS